MSARRVAVAVLGVVHALGIVGAPFAARLHVFQPGATPHENFHVVWEAFKYLTASGLAFAVVVGPYARGEAWARWTLFVATLTLFGGGFAADAITQGAPPIEHWAFGTFLVVSLFALGGEAIATAHRDAARRARARAKLARTA